MADANIQVIGDSVFGSDAERCASIAGFMSLRLELKVTDNAIPGATVIGEDGILGDLPGFEIILAVPALAFVARRFRN